MKLSKRLLRAPLTQALIARFLSGYISLVLNTTRWRVEMPEETRQHFEGDCNFIGCFWHARMVMMCRAWHENARRRFHMLISAHRDGRVIAKAIENLGFSTVEGSSRRGGAAALVNIKRILDRGETVGFTPDGPKGPRMRAKLGAIKAAQVTGRPVIPVSGNVARRKVFGSWDRFCLPLPFNRGVILWGTPIHVPRKANEEELERLRLELEKQLNELTARCDAEFGHPPIRPADPLPKNRDSRRASA